MSGSRSEAEIAHVLPNVLPNVFSRVLLVTLSCDDVRLDVRKCGISLLELFFPVFKR